MARRNQTTILSLFDGISCGRLALDRAGIRYDCYLSSEIDGKAIAVTMHNHPYTVQLGNVSNLSADMLPPITILMGGSPCQGFSSVGKGEGLDDPRSMLFWEFVRLIRDCRPKHFLLENVPMRKDWNAIITEALGVEPISINSNLVSAQNRTRLYWTNIPGISQPDDLGITLDDIIEEPAEYKVAGSWEKYVPESRPRFVDPYNHCEITRKSTSLRTNINNGNMWVRTPNGDYRNLSVTECERLQTLPEGYTSIASPAQAKKMIGNGWTVDVIAHILRSI
jgi:DNA (cytosine-5)-methyltransferase 3A